MATLLKRDSLWPMSYGKYKDILSSKSFMIESQKNMIIKSPLQI